MTIDWEHVADEALGHLQALLRIDTTNPPGNERQAADYLAEVLAAEGYSPVVLESAPGRGNVVARCHGSDESSPLLLLSHLDVVPVEPEHWDHDPFGGEVIDGTVWGRGALDMKSIVVMQLMTMLLLKRRGNPLERDVVFAATADEEEGGRYGAGFLVDHHLDLIHAGHALSEFGGFSVDLAGRRFYLCQVAEKGVCWIRMRARGRPGHGSMPEGETAVVKLAAAVTKLGRTSLPFHRTGPTEEMIGAFARGLGGIRGGALRLLLNPTLSPVLLRLFVRDRFLASLIHVLLHNTVSPTVLHAGSKTNVVPSVAQAELDGRVLPGQDLSSLLAELQGVVGPGYEFDPIQVSLPTATSSRTPLFAAMAQGLLRHDPQATIVPMMMPGATDAKHLARAGIPCYGFSPMRLPPAIDFMGMIHGHNERIPVETLAFGVRVLYEVTEDYCATPESRRTATQ